MRTEKTEKTWTCWGSVRGSCGEEHTTYGDAERHYARDGRACSRGASKGYSDRHPHQAEGGDLVNGLRIKDGKVTRHEVEQKLGKVIK